MRVVAEPVVERLYESVRAAWPSAPVLDSGQLESLKGHFALLRKWNPKINLVGPSTLDVAAVKHYAESLLLASHLPEDVRTILDVGTGAGFPGFPLAVLRSDVGVTLLESDRRKAAFLRESCTLDNVTVLCRRLEEVDIEVDAVITRAVDPRFVIAWGARHAARFGFVGSSADCQQLSGEPVLCDSRSTCLPWNPASSILWAMFHVEHS